MSEIVEVGDWVYLTGSEWEKHFPDLFETDQQVTDAADSVVWFKVGEAPNEIVYSGILLSTSGYAVEKTRGPVTTYDSGTEAIAAVDKAQAAPVGYSVGENILPSKFGGFVTGGDFNVSASYLIKDGEVTVQIPPTPSEFEARVTNALDIVKRLLVEKNKAYGDSALNPVRIFSEASTTEQLRVRIDDKLKRIHNGDTTEDVTLDLIGYLVLLKLAEEDTDHANRSQGDEG